MRIHLSPPALIFTATNTLKSWQAGATRGPVIVLRPGTESDSGLLEHELLHAWHWWLYGLLAVALIALAGWVAGDIQIAEFAVPAWSFAPIGLATNSLLYAWWPEWREAEEIAAYRVQAACYPDDRLPMFAEFLATSYGLDITAAEALQRLREG